MVSPKWCQGLTFKETIQTVKFGIATALERTDGCLDPS